MATHPAWALKHKKKGTELRNIRGHYYLYEVTSKWDPALKRSKKITGRMLGKITKEDGFVESDKERLRKQSLKVENLKVKEFGISNYIEKQLPLYTKLLKKHFPTHWKTLIGLVYGRLVYQAPLKNMSFHFHHSYLSELHDGVDLSAKTLSKTLNEIGYQREKITDFFKEFNADNDCILIDGTDLCSDSKKIDLCEHSKSKNGVYRPLINTMFVYSVAQQLPLYYRLLPGKIKDVKAFSLCLKESGIHDATIIADKGFYSKKNIDELDKEKLQYIIPLRRDNALIDYAALNLNDKKSFDGYFEFEKRFIWYRIFELKKEKKKVVVFLDEELKTNEEKDYLLRITNEIENYSIEEFYEKQKSFGTIAMYTNKHKTASEIYVDYKSRGAIEGMIDTMKNVLDADKSYMQNEQTLEGWMFVNYIALHWYYSIYKLLSQHDLNKKYSPTDFLQMLKEIRKVNIQNKWYNAEVIKRTTDMMEKIGLPIT